MCQLYIHWCGVWSTQLCDSCIYNNYTCYCRLITHICVTDWTDAGYGVSDVENLVDCKPSSVMRVASISKPLTMVAIAQLWEQGKLDLDIPIQHYVPSWPDKVFQGQKVFRLNTEILFLFCCCAALRRSPHCVAPCLPTHPSVFLSICPSIQCLWFIVGGGAMSSRRIQNCSCESWLSEVKTLFYFEKNNSYRKTKCDDERVKFVK